jgi:hypothetical protein
MSRPPEPIGSLFPLGGPVPSDLIIGRRGAQSARRTSSDIATEFDVQMGIDEAERHLHDDGA